MEEKEFAEWLENVNSIGHQDVLTEEQKNKIKANLYICFDKLAETSSPISESPSNAAAIRAFEQIPEIASNRNDFSICHVGYRLADGTVLGFSPLPLDTVSFRK